jgi:hypothetical protein
MREINPTAAGNAPCPTMSVAPAAGQSPRVEFSFGYASGRIDTFKLGAGSENHQFPQ